MPLPTEDVVRLLLAILAGGLIGAEREYRDKVAGFRTIILICVGATLFTLFSVRLGGSEDPARIAANIVSGVGFLGAGAILRDSGRVTGLTTASTIWLAAALGMGIGAGAYLLTGVAVGLVLVVLLVFPRIESHIENAREWRTYEVTSAIDPALCAELEGTMVSCGLRVAEGRRTKAGEDMISTWSATGPPEAHRELAEKLLSHPRVKQFKA